MQEFLFKTRYFERGLSKSLLKKGFKHFLLTLFFLSNPVPFNGRSYKNKRGLELVISHSTKQV